ncbi:unnamed protein product [marine sediment metagenome]|uniref:ArnR1-like winged helix-turn-helix domain-containing protein n=1 Tax=marine sediment metagenome TaxID=412755 RepID=X0T556_9ZZZZ
MFKTYFGNTKTIKILDFLADHVSYEYTLEAIENYTGISIYIEIKNLVEFGFVIKEDKKYKLNTENDLIKAMLKFDFEYVKKIADKS